MYNLLAQAQSPNAYAGFIFIIVFFGIMFLLLYFIMIRPQKKRLRMLSNIKKNDHVLTSGGKKGILRFFLSTLIVTFALSVPLIFMFFPSFNGSPSMFLSTPLFFIVMMVVPISICLTAGKALVCGKSPGLVFALPLLMIILIIAVFIAFCGITSFLNYIGIVAPRGSGDGWTGLAMFTYAIGLDLITSIVAPFFLYFLRNR